MSAKDKPHSKHCTDAYRNNHELIWGKKEMGEVIQMPKRNIQHASTEQLKREWDLWADSDLEELDGVEFHYEQIHSELNRRDEGEYCAV